MPFNESFCQKTTFVSPFCCNFVLSVLCGVIEPHINQVGYFPMSILTLGTDPTRQNFNLGPLEVSLLPYGTVLGHILAFFVS